MSFAIAWRMLRRTQRPSAVLGRYLWFLPVLLYGLLLLLTAGLAASVSPAIFPLVLMFGAILLIGITIHAIGLFPLIYFNDRFLIGTDPAHRA